MNPLAIAPGDRDPLRSLQQESRHILWQHDEGVCGDCTKPVEWPESSTGHIIPHSIGGATDQENLAIEHLICNMAKRDRFDPQAIPVVQIPSGLLIPASAAAEYKERTGLKTSKPFVLGTTETKVAYKPGDTGAGLLDNIEPHHIIVAVITLAVVTAGGLILRKQLKKRKANKARAFLED